MCVLCPGGIFQSGVLCLCSVFYHHLYPMRVLSEKVAFSVQVVFFLGKVFCSGDIISSCGKPMPRYSVFWSDSVFWPLQVVFSIQVVFSAHVVGGLPTCSVFCTGGIPFHLNFYSAYFCNCRLPLRRIKHKRLAISYVLGHSRGRHQQRHQGGDGIKEGRPCQRNVIWAFFPE